MTLGSQNLLAPTNKCTTVDGLAYSCSYKLVAGDTAGSKTFSVQATDKAGNLDLATADVIFDFTGPAITTSSADPASASRKARIGDVVLYYVETDEALLTDPTADSFKRQSGTETLAFASFLSQPASNRYGYRYPVKAGARTAPTLRRSR